MRLFDPRILEFRALFVGNNIRKCGVQMDSRVVGSASLGFVTKYFAGFLVQCYAVLSLLTACVSVTVKAMCVEQ